MLLKLLWCHGLIRLATQSIVSFLVMLRMLGIPARSQVLIRRDVVKHQAKRIEEETNESGANHSRIESHSHAQ